MLNSIRLKFQVLNKILSTVFRLSVKSWLNWNSFAWQMQKKPQKQKNCCKQREAEEAAKQLQELKRKEEADRQEVAMKTATKLNR